MRFGAKSCLKLVRQLEIVNARQSLYFISKVSRNLHLKFLRFFFSSSLIQLTLHWESVIFFVEVFFFCELTWFAAIRVNNKSIINIVIIVINIIVAYFLRSFRIAACFWHRCVARSPRLLFSHDAATADNSWTGHVSSSFSKSIIAHFDWIWWKGEMEW